MSVILVTDVFCDKCNCWGNHSSGSKPDVAGARKAVIQAGWKSSRTTEGRIEHTCPACLGDEPDFWQRWYEKDRGIYVKQDE